MFDEWYYSHADAKVGPCSGRQLKELAASGQILPTDSIWKEGIVRAVLASKVKNLFSLPANVSNGNESEVISEPTPSLQARGIKLQSDNSTSANSSETLRLLGQAERDANNQNTTVPLRLNEAQTKPDSSSIPGDLELRPIEETPPINPNSGWGPKPAGRARATAGKGAIIVGQDGTTVQFRKKCTTCGHEDNCRSRMPIRQGTTKVGFYCSKCRKRREVEIQGFAK
jgi:hypothetical protein